MKITNVEAIVLESPYENKPPQGSEEAHGVKHCLLLKVTTDEGITGWSDVETAPHVVAAVVEDPVSGSAAWFWAKIRSMWSGSGIRFTAAQSTMAGAAQPSRSSPGSISPVTIL